MNDMLWRLMVPKTLRFALRLATRHLRAGGGQTLFTISAVATGVIIIVFITALIFGLRQKLTTVLIEAIPHITIQVEEVKPEPLQQVLGTSAGTSSSRIEQQAPQRKHIENWPQVTEVVRHLPSVRLAAPAIKGQGFASKGGNPVGVSVIGADPALQDAVTPVTKYLIAGRYQNLSSDEIVIDVKLAADLNVATGERLRLTSSTGASDVFTIAGIYTRGQGRGDAYITLRQAQSLYGLGTSVNTIFVKLYAIFAADRVADRIMALLPYEAKSWSREFPNFVSSLHAQSAVAYLTSIFSLIASSFATASVLIVSVLQKSRQIGILKSMGACQRQIRTVFILEGLGVAIIGSAVGALLGTSMVYVLSLIKQPVTYLGRPPEQLFPVTVLPGYIALAIMAAVMSTVLAAWLPARRAARLNPVEAMR
jgi:lipoprotein-releasing system permease protein